MSGRIAWKFRSRAIFALPPAESPSTMYNSHSAGSVSLQSASLPGSPPPSRTPLRRASSLALRAASRARAAWLHLSSTCRAVRRILLEVLRQELRPPGGDDPGHLAVAELGLGLPLELGIDQLDAEHGGQPLADVVADRAPSLSRPFFSP